MKKLFFLFISIVFTLEQTYSQQDKVIDSLSLKSLPLSVTDTIVKNDKGDTIIKVWKEKEIVFKELFYSNGLLASRILRWGKNFHLISEHVYYCSGELYYHRSYSKNKLESSFYFSKKGELVFAVINTKRKHREFYPNMEEYIISMNEYGKCLYSLEGNVSKKIK